MPSETHPPSEHFVANLDAWRFILILLVVLNHALVFGMTFEDMNALGQATVIVTRASVPALSLFSGYLFVCQRNRSVRILLTQKIRSLILPFLVWNTGIFILLLGLNEWLQIDPSRLPAQRSRFWLINNLTAFYGGPANEPLYFLRDLFVCCILFGLLRPLLRYPLCLGAVLALLVLNYVTDLDGRLFIRNAIPLFFLLGIGFSLFPYGIAILRRSLLPLSLIAALLVLTWVIDDVDWSSTSVLGLTTLAVFSALTVGLAASRPPMPRFANWGRRFAFIIFLSHAWIIQGLQILWSRHDWDEVSYIALACTGSVLVGLILAALIGRLPTGVAAILVGGRIGRTRPTNHPAQAVP